MTIDSDSVGLWVLLTGLAVWAAWWVATIAIPAQRMSAFLISGEYTRALPLVHRLETRSSNSLLANGIACVLISAGQYQRALALDGKQSKTDFFWPLLQVNLAEAEYNAGRWEHALARLDCAVQKIRAEDKVTKTGEACQRAWILAHLGRHDEAATAYARAKVGELPSAYASEYHFTRCFMALMKGLGAEALAAVDEGLRVAQRLSTKRNGLFLRAQALQLVGQTDEALAEFQRAADHEFKFHGGGGFLAWGDLLASLGRREEAKKAWRLAVERDAESESAALAAKRLAPPSAA